MAELRITWPRCAPGRVASRNFLTICLTKILTISAQCGLTPQASEGRIRWVLAMTIIRIRSQHS
jgi:hypothetical protein